MMAALRTPGAEAMRTVRELRPSTALWSWERTPKPHAKQHLRDEDFFESNLDQIEELTGWRLPKDMQEAANAIDRC